MRVPIVPLDKYQGDYRISLIDSPNLDAFGRLRISLPQTQYSYSNQYGLTSLFLESWVDGTGTVSHQPNASSILLSTGSGTSGASANIQTKQYFRYTSGKSLLILLSCNIGIRKTGLLKSIGYFDDKNGIFFGQDENGTFVTLRSYVTGSVVEQKVYQDDWNIDAFDGHGPSGILMQEGNIEIYIIDIEWLGSGRVRMGVIIDGVIYYGHQFLNANNITTAYMTTANLPFRAQIENTGTATGSNDLLIICSTVITEGNVDDSGYYEHSANNGITSIAVTTRRPILSIRPKALINGITNRALINNVEFSIIASTNTAFFEIVYNGTLGGSPSWQSSGANSAVEFDTAGTTITGGEVIYSGYVPSGSGNNSTLADKFISERFPIALDRDGSNPTILSIVATSLAATSNVSAAMNFREYF